VRQTYEMIGGSTLAGILLADKYSKYGCKCASEIRPISTILSASLPRMYISPTGSPAMIRFAFSCSVSGFHGPLLTVRVDADDIDLETAALISADVGQERDLCASFSFSIARSIVPRM